MSTLKEKIGNDDQSFDKLADLVEALAVRSMIHEKMIENLSEAVDLLADADGDSLASNKDFRLGGETSEEQKIWSI